MMQDSRSRHHIRPRMAERVEVQVLVDNVTDQLSTNPQQVHSELSCLLHAGMVEWSGEAICCAHFGLSLVVTAYAEGRAYRVLFDAGPEGYAVERNGRRLGIQFGSIGAAVLSHGHWDHGGGLPRAAELIRESGGRRVPLYLHPGVFRRRALRLPNGGIVPFKPIPSCDELSARGTDVQYSSEPRLLPDGLFCLSGEIPRVTAYERGFPSHLRQREDGAGWEPDPLILDEQFLAVCVEGKGVVVFTACSHSGVVNVLTRAHALFPDMPLYAVMGGLHLSGPGPEQIIPETVRDLSRFGLTMIIPAHCTGWRAVAALVNAFGEGVVVPSAVGKRYHFSRSDRC